MARKQIPEPSQKRKRRLEELGAKRKADASAEADALDGMVRRSIEKHGA